LNRTTEKSPYVAPVAPSDKNNPHKYEIATLGDVQRALGRIARAIEQGTIEWKVGSVLVQAYTALFRILQDKRDSKFKTQLAILWKERQKYLSAGGSVIDATPTLPADSSVITDAEIIDPKQKADVERIKQEVARVIADNPQVSAAIDKEIAAEAQTSGARGSNKDAEASDKEDK
jgi:hypothetical protein